MRASYSFPYLLSTMFRSSSPVMSPPQFNPSFALAPDDLPSIESSKNRKNSSSSSSSSSVVDVSFALLGPLFEAAQRMLRAFRRVTVDTNDEDEDEYVE